MTEFEPLFGVFDTRNSSVHCKIVLTEGVVHANFFSKEFFHFEDNERQALFGYSDENRLISLLYLVVKSDAGSKTHLKSGRTLYYSELCPRYIVTGDRFFDPANDKISEVEIYHPKFEHLCHDPSRLKEVIKPDEAIRILEENGLIVKDLKDNGWRSRVCILRDRGVLSSCKTNIGEIRFESTLSLPGFSTYRKIVENRTAITLRFNEPQSLFEAISRVDIFRSLAEMSVGQEIVLDEFAFRVPEQIPEDSPLIIQICDLKFGSRRSDEDRWLEAVDWRSALISNFKREEEFVRVLTAWCNANDKRIEARHRLLEGIRQGSLMSIDRFVGACNAFDLLPDECFADIPGPPLNLVSLKKDIKKLVVEADVPEELRGWVHDAIGRVGSKTLRDKVLERLKIISRHSGGILPNANIAVVHAIKLRNRYVHGSETTLSVEENERFFAFFGQLVEAIFVFSDLIECGLDLKEKLKLVQGHPLFWFNHGFSANMVELEKAIKGHSKQGSR